MTDVKDFQKKYKELNALLDPNKASDSLTATDYNELCILCLRMDAVVRDLKNTDQKNKNIKSAINALNEIEYNANKILKKERQV